MAKATKLEKEARITQVVELLCQGIGPHQVSRILTEEKGWELSRRQCRKYLRWARDYFIQESKINRDEMLGLAISRLADLYSKSYEEKDYRTSLMVQKELNELAELKKTILEGEMEHTIRLERVISNNRGKTIQVGDD